MCFGPGLRDKFETDKMGTAVESNLYHLHDNGVVCLWPPYVIWQAIYIFILWFLLLSFFSSPNLSGRRLDVYHTSTHGVALV